MSIAAKTFKLVAEEKEPNSFEYVSGRHRLLMSKTMESDAPVTWFSPVDFLLAGIAGCLGLTLRAKMEKEGLDFKDLRIEVEAVRPEGADRSGVQSVKTSVFLKTKVPHAKMLELVEECEEKCTVRNTLDHRPAFSTEVCLEG